MRSSACLPHSSRLRCPAPPSGKPCWSTPPWQSSCRGSWTDYNQFLLLLQQPHHLVDVIGCVLPVDGLGQIFQVQLDLPGGIHPSPGDPALIEDPVAGNIKLGETGSPLI